MPPTGRPPFLSPKLGERQAQLRQRAIDEAAAAAASARTLADGELGRMLVHYVKMVHDFAEATERQREGYARLLHLLEEELRLTHAALRCARDQQEG